MQVVDVNGNMFGYDHLEIIGVDGKPKTTGGGGGGGSITIGTTTISSGTVGRILFEGTGNVVQESANLNFDIATNNFIIGTTATSSPKLLITSLNRSDILLRSGAATNDTLSIYAFGGTYGSNYAQIGVNDGVNAANQGGAIYLDSRTGTAPPIRLTVKGTGTTAMTNAMSVFNTGNVAINTIIDSGYKLDVNGTIRSNGIIYAGPFTPGAGLQATDYIATTGRVRAAGGISFRSPIVGDNTFNGFAPGGNGILVYLSNGTPITFGGYGADTNPIIQTTADFNPSSGSGNKSSISIVGVYQASGSYSGGIRGLYYNPTLISMTGVAFHRAIETTSGNVVFNGGNVLIGTTTDSGYKLDVNGTFKVSGAIYDSTNSPGTSGQVLSSTVTGTAWVSAGGGGASIIKLSAQTLTAASWSLSGGYYISTFSNVNITTNTRVDFTPDNSAYSEVTTCGMLPEVDVFAGSCRFYSLFPPQSDILGEITIFPTI